MSTTLSKADRLKFHLLAEGVSISATARQYLKAHDGTHELSPADFASTSGVILRLDDEVWVNAPIADFNPNFVDTPRFRLDTTENGLVVYGLGFESKADFWLSPRYHGMIDDNGIPLNSFVFTHGDRVRLSPIQGCAMACKFCNIPYEDKYGTKPIDTMLSALRRALDDDVQPGRHVLISGGTPRPADHNYLRAVYAEVLQSFSGVEIDIMMVPVPGLLEVRDLARLGVHELSINIELFTSTDARTFMSQKQRQGIDHYLDFIAEASAVLGPGRVRSMLMVGLEPMEGTLAGVSAILERGGVPVLSPFRPDPSTPLHDFAPPDAMTFQETFLRADELAQAAGTELGPACPPCTHNTLTLSTKRGAPVDRCPSPRLV